MVAFYRTYDNSATRYIKLAVLALRPTPCHSACEFKVEASAECSFENLVYHDLLVG